VANKKYYGTIINNVVPMMIGRKPMIEEKILLAVLKLFEEKGIHFTTLDLATELKTSKRTIYAYFPSKDVILEKTIDFVFQNMRESDHRILENQSLSIRERIGLYLNNVPDVYSISALIHQLDDLKQYYPRLGEKMDDYLDNTWDDFMILLEEGISKKEIEAVDTTILKIMLKETLKKLLDYNTMIQSGYEFHIALNAMSYIVLQGIYKR